MQEKKEMSVRYNSTRGEQKDMGFEDVVLSGLATDRGLFVPETIPTFTLDQIEQMRRMSYPEVAYEVISQFIKSDEVPSTDLRAIINASFETFRTAEVAPSVRLKDFWVLELFHGPTFAFKDVALQFLGNLFQFFLKRGKRQSRLTILGATSGDTGSAAIHGLRGKANVHCFIMFPHGKVTEVQERQMTTVLDDNVRCLSIAGDFDDCQELVKKAFADADFRNEVQLGAVNSINWARVLAQITYYYFSWFRVTDGLKVHNDHNLNVNFAVPTGNFGDILAGYYAKRMGLPIDKLVVCTNQNDVLHRFFESGIYEKHPARSTIAPSMDISVSSNFERFLFHLTNDNAITLANWMKEFETTGKLIIGSTLMKRAKAEFLSSSSTRAEIVTAMQNLFTAEGYLACPHTATAVAAVSKLNLEAAHTVVLATAHPAKFEEAVALALVPLGVSLPARPEALEMLFSQTTVKWELNVSLPEVQTFMRSALCEDEERDKDRKLRNEANVQITKWAIVAGLVAVVGVVVTHVLRTRLGKR